MVGESRAALAVVEAAYRLEGSDDAWLASLAEAARPLVDVGLGAWAILYEVRAGAFEITAGVEVGGTPSDWQPSTRPRGECPPAS